MRLQEYGHDVLVLEKEGGEKYSVVSGTPEKMIEHLMDIAAKDDDSGEDRHVQICLHHCDWGWRWLFHCCGR